MDVMGVGVYGPRSSASGPPSTPLLSFPDGPPQNLLLISIDTVRRDRVGRYDGSPTTPFLDEWLSTSVVLDNHRSCSSWTGPSMMCATTGQSPLELGYFTGRASEGTLESVASLLGDEGYTSHLVSANPFFFGPVDAIGFETVESAGLGPEHVAETAVNAIQTLRRKERPWYLHVHFFAPHHPYCPPAAYLPNDLPDLGFDLCTELERAQVALADNGTAAQRAQFLEQVDILYRAEIRYTDDVIRGLWAELGRLGVLDDALVGLFTDHGEQLLERGHIGHAEDLFAEETRAVAAFWARDLPPSLVTAPTQHEDLAATLFNVYDLAPARQITGRVLGTSEPDRLIRLINRAGVLQVAVAQQDWQLTYAFDGQRALHHDATDLAHHVDQYAPEHPMTQQLWSELSPLVDQVTQVFESDPPVNPAP